MSPYLISFSVALCGLTRFYKIHRKDIIAFSLNSVVGGGVNVRVKFRAILRHYSPKERKPAKG